MKRYLFFFFICIATLFPNNKVNTANAKNKGHNVISEIQDSISLDSIRELAKDEELAGYKDFEETKLLDAQNHYKKARDLFKLAGEKYWEAEMCADIAHIAIDINQGIDDAIEDYKRAITLYKECDKGEKLIGTMLKLREIYLNNGLSDKASEISDSINNELATIHPSYNLYVLLGDEQKSLKNYEQALTYFTKAKEMLEPVTEDNLGQYNIVCTDQIEALYFCKRYEDVIKLSNYLFELDSIHCSETTIAAIKLRTTYSLLSYLYSNRIEEAQKYLNNLQNKYKNNPSISIRSLPYSLGVSVFRDMGDFKNMYYYAELTDSILAQEQTAVSDDRLDMLACKIIALQKQNRDDEAVRLMRYRCSLKSDIYKNNREEQKKDLFYLANAEALSAVNGTPSDMDSAKVHLAEYVRLQTKAIKEQAPWLTAQQRDAFWGKSQKTMQSVYGFALGTKAVREPFLVDIYNSHLLTHGLLLQTDKSIYDVIFKYGNDDDKALLQKYTEIKDSISDSRKSQNIEKTAKFQIQLQAIESQIMKTATRLSDFTAFLDVDYSDVHSHLKQGEVIIDFAEQKRNDESFLDAFIIRSEWKYPHIIRICNCADIKEMSESLDAKIYEDSLSRKITSMLMDSVIKYVHPSERVYYIPAGIVHGIALENLKNSDGKLLSDIYAFRRLSSAKEILNYSDKDRKPQTAVLYGGLSYGDYKQCPDTVKVSALTPDGEERGIGDVYQSLPATALEVKDISSTLRKFKVKTTCLEKDLGTEESFMALDGKSPDIIHLATHGFYLSPDYARNVGGLAGYTDAMRLSGLILSGGNAGWLGITKQDGTKDGILSAEDIASLDLSNTKLAVLSACKTAKGQISPEGIFGLQRAFKKAGVESIVMTLWGVNDKITAVFMSTFYKELAKTGWDKHKALQNTRDIIKAQYPEPYYWAGFIMLD